MQAALHNFFRALAGVLCLLPGIVFAQDAPPPPLEVLISVADQKLVMLRDGGVIGKYKISTSKFGVGDSYGSYKTPLGHFRVCDKIGGELEPGAVIKHRSATGEVIAVNAPGRDPIVTRVIWLDGLEEQNHNARARGIYIHGTPEENNLGKPVSWGCIRMRSEDVIEIFNEIPPGTPVNIIPDRLPRLHKYKAPPPPPEILAAATPAPAARPAPPATAPARTQFPPVAEQKPTAAPEIARYTVGKAGGNSPISRVSEQIARMNAETAMPAKPSSNPGAWRAMKGSILLAGMPGAPAPAPKPAPAPAGPDPQNNAAAALLTEEILGKSIFSLREISRGLSTGSDKPHADSFSQSLLAPANPEPTNRFALGAVAHGASRAEAKAAQ